MKRTARNPGFRRSLGVTGGCGEPDQDLTRSITIVQVRTLQPIFATTPSVRARRVVVIDAIDDLEHGGANAMLENPEEPTAGTIFLLVTHAPVAAATADSVAMQIAAVRSTRRE